MKKWNRIDLVNGEFISTPIDTPTPEELAYINEMEQMDMENDLFDLWNNGAPEDWDLYSDLYKDLHGVRPRWQYKAWQERTARE